jgi:ArsR family transcriptional regulator
MEEMQALKCLAALAHATRLDVFRALVKCGAKGLSAGEIAERFGIPASTLSFHLKELVQAGLVQGTRRSQQVVYAVDFGAMRGMLQFLTEDCCKEENPAASDACACSK